MQGQLAYTGMVWEKLGYMITLYLPLALFFIVTYYIQISSAKPFFFSVALCHLLIWGKFKKNSEGERCTESTEFDLGLLKSQATPQKESLGVTGGSQEGLGSWSSWNVYNRARKLSWKQELRSLSSPWYWGHHPVSGSSLS